MAVFLKDTDINQVAQSGGTIAIASSTVQGGNDTPPTIDNMGPSLIFWKEKSGIFPVPSNSENVAMIEPFIRILSDVHSHKNLWYRYYPPRGDHK